MLNPSPEFFSMDSRLPLLLPDLVHCVARLRDSVWLLKSRGLSGSSSAVERQLPKLDVAGSIPVSRSIDQTFSRIIR